MTTTRRSFFAWIAGAFAAAPALPDIVKATAKPKMEPSFMIDQLFPGHVTYMYKGVLIREIASFPES